jgi:exosortase
MNGFMSVTTGRAPSATPAFPWPLALALLAAAWCYAPTLASLYHQWMSEPQHSHGLLVPLFAGYLLYLRRDLWQPIERPWPLIGLGLIALALGLRVVSGYYGILWPDRLSLLPCALGLALAFGGRVYGLWVWPAVLFLFFMIPMPYRLETALTGRLQTLATIGSTFALQTLGQPAIAEGNVISIGEIRLGIVEACSGLRMLMTFFAFSTAVALLVNRPLFERLLIVASAVPIAVIANMVRITGTGLLYTHVDSHTAQMFFHDLAGWFMMPICLGLLWLELKLLERLFIEVPPAPTGA